MKKRNVAQENRKRRHKNFSYGKYCHPEKMFTHTEETLVTASKNVRWLEYIFGIDLSAKL